MHSFVIPSVLLAAGIASAAPSAKRDFSPDNVYYPMADGFPNPSQDQIMKIDIEAHGILPNGPPPPKLSQEAITSLQLIALNELFEVAYFTEFAYNISNKVPGYDLGNSHPYAVDTLNSIVAQEKLHELSANGALAAFKAPVIQPCKYSFPVTDFRSAVQLAATFTDLVLGTLQDVAEVLAESGDTGLVRTIASVIGNEGEQEGFYRLILSKRPSAKPFLTSATRDFAFSAIKSFVVPNSCPNIDTIKLKTFLPLNVESTNIKAQTQNLKFSWSKTADTAKLDIKTLKVVYLNGLTQPIVKELQNVVVGTDKVTFEAAFPYDEFVLDGLTIAAVTTGADQFDSPRNVSQHAVFGPGIIQID
ncbi:hypothetical protein IQ06DRAFT_291024 [Phaeosphaeriaceae sp. SRC1lsM3a]|nr:hypothetical protein IQ06DRAFT_291024 [Stagonospora sp. SRC1lsM3a]